MKTSTIMWAVLIIIVAVGGGWYYYSRSPSGGLQVSNNQNNTEVKTRPSPLAVSQSASSGAFLSSSVTGMTLYTYSQDTSGVSNCSGQCATNWPPYRVEPGVTFLAGAGVNGELGTVVRADGGLQLTYNGAPLYTYIKDTKPGDTVGQGVGGVWYVGKP